MSLKGGHARWAFDLSGWRPNLSDLLLATSCIQLEEKQRLAKFMYRESFDSSLIGRLLMRRFIKHCIPEIDYNKIVFERDARGKPFLSQAMSYDRNIQVNFNVSHHESYAVLAGCVTSTDCDNQQDVDKRCSQAQTVGVDVMKMIYSGGKPLHEFFRIMNSNFTPNEWMFIKSRKNGSQQTDAFMRHWCLKESYTKNIGVGITTDLQKIDFQVKTETLSEKEVTIDTTVIVDGSLLSDWMFEESLIDDKHCAAVAIHNPTNEYINEKNRNKFLFEKIDFDVLMKDAIPLLDQDLEYCQNVLRNEYKNL